MYQRILVPVDGSTASDRGLKEAVSIAKESNAQLCLVHAIEDTAIAAVPSSGLYVRAMLEAVRRSGEIVLQRATAAVKAQGMESESRLLENFTGRVAEAIVDEARRWGADLIVMGTHGRRGVSHLFLGSDAEMVVRLSDVPVLLVRAPAAAAARRAAA